MSMAAHILSPLEQNLKRTLDQIEKRILSQCRYSSFKYFSCGTLDNGGTSYSLKYTVDIYNCMPQKRIFHKFS